MKTQEWTVSDTENAEYLGMTEFQDKAGECHVFEMLKTRRASKTPWRIVFGSSCNAGFLESGYLELEDCESFRDALSECMGELNCYYNDGPQYVSRIICNERM